MPAPKSPRVILYSGKGGVGKTTIAAATGVAAAGRGLDTIVLSLDVAHSLSDAFDLDVDLTNHSEGRPVQVADRLHIQEVDVHVELERYWGDIVRYLTALFQQSGFDGVVAEELAVLPGMEDVVSLLYLNRYLDEGRYDVIILDCAPTGESLRFVSLPSVLEWYMRKLFRLERRAVQVARPLLRSLIPVPLPGEEYFDAVERLYRRLEGVDEVLQDASRTTVRLVTNPEKMVVRETQRAYLYFCLYNMVVDEVVANRVYPDEPGSAFLAGWRSAQEAYLRQMEELFAPARMRTLELLDGEVVGLDRLEEIGRRLYGDEKPEACRASRAPYRFQRTNGGTLLEVDLPFTQRDGVDLAQRGDELILTVGGFKRHVPLPRSVRRHRIASAQYRDGALCVMMEEKVDHGEEDHKQDRRGQRAAG
jgi:arsenite-transporting ATPase